MNSEHSEKKRNYNLLLTLMLAGIIPFIFSAILMHTNMLAKSTILTFLLSYTAVILSFLGGIQWGIGVMRLDSHAYDSPHLFIVSIIPSLVAWLFLLIHHPKVQLIGYMLSFAIVAVADSTFSLKGIMPRWFLMLRWVVTISVITLLILCYSGL
jgi:hypothetical protein